MFFIPGQLITLLTFPGVIVHELGHQLMCRWMGVAVFDVCYFQMSNPAGYVVHEVPRKPIQSLLISIAPALVNTVLGALIALPAFLPIDHNHGTMYDTFLMWLGISIAMHAFPSIPDANAMWASVWAPGGYWLLRLISLPLVAFIYLGALGSIIWLDVIYGYLVASFFPRYIVTLLA